MESFGRFERTSQSSQSDDFTIFQLQSFKTCSFRQRKFKDVREVDQHIGMLAVEYLSKYNNSNQVFVNEFLTWIEIQFIL